MTRKKWQPKPKAKPIKPPTRNEQRRILRELGYARRLVLGSWSCPTSPVLGCVYDPAEDPEHDRCIFCRQPEERK